LLRCAHRYSAHLGLMLLALETTRLLQREPKDRGKVYAKKALLCSPDIRDSWKSFFCLFDLGFFSFLGIF
jgi:hypothetical protein